jgi:hypothetical protein
MEPHPSRCARVLVAAIATAAVGCGSSSGGATGTAGTTGTRGKSGTGGGGGGAAVPTLYYTAGGVVYQMVPGAGNDVSMAADFDSSVTDLTTQ